MVLDEEREEDPTLREEEKGAGFEEGETDVERETEEGKGREEEEAEREEGLDSRVTVTLSVTKTVVDLLDLDVTVACSPSRGGRALLLDMWGDEGEGEGK